MEMPQAFTAVLTSSRGIAVNVLYAVHDVPRPILTESARGTSPTELEKDAVLFLRQEENPHRFIPD